MTHMAVPAFPAN